MAHDLRSAIVVVETESQYCHNCDQWVEATWKHLSAGFHVVLLFLTLGLVLLWWGFMLFAAPLLGYRVPFRCPNCGKKCRKGRDVHRRPKGRLPF